MLLPHIRVTLVRTTRGHWNWSVGNEAGTDLGGGCGTPEQALKEALYSIDWVSAREEPKGEA